jgi:hypothetical protein
MEKYCPFGDAYKICVEERCWRYASCMQEEIKSLFYFGADLEAATLIRSVKEKISEIESGGLNK